MPRFTVEREDRSFDDAHGVTIHYSVWRAPRPTAVIQLLHGLGEHALRYEDFAQDLVNSGFTVVADDHRGHGRTGLGQHDGEYSKLGRLGVGGIRATVAAVRQVTGIIREEFPDVPVVLLGHSFGSLLAQWIANEASEDFDALVLSGTAFRTLRHANGGDLSARHLRAGGTETSWLSRDPAVGERFSADPLNFKAQGLKLFGVADTLRLLGKPTRFPKPLPVLIQIGSDDPFGGPRSVELLAAAYRRQGLTDVTVTVYPDARHEVYNETNRDEVIAELVSWLDAHLQYRPPRRRR